MGKSISILKEHKEDENRVVLLPEDIAIFVNNGYTVYVEQGAGLGIGIEDKSYKNAGALILSREDAWKASTFIVKYKAPISEEFQFLNSEINLCAIFHAEGNVELVNTLCDKGPTAYSYEFFETEDGIFPLAVVGGEISGKLAVIYGAYHLLSPQGGRGVLLADIIGARRPKVIVIGYGNVGSAAVKTAQALGNEVVVFGTDRERLSKYQRAVGSDVRCLLYTPESFEQEIIDADLIVGAILVSTYNTPPILLERHLKKMKKGSMIIDVTCGYGDGYLPTFSNFTTFKKPTYHKEGILHCKIDILPSSVPITTSKAFSKNIAPYILKLGESIFSNKYDPISERGKIIEQGKIMNSIVSENIRLYHKIHGEEFIIWKTGSIL